MTTQQATAEVFWTAFKALPKTARRNFLARLAADRPMREDLLDLAVIESRRSQKTRPFTTYLAERATRK